MKKLMFLLCILMGTQSQAQSTSGTWEGNLSVQGTEIPLVIHISPDSAGKLTASFDSPSQHAYNLPCSEVILKGDSLILMMKILNGRYAGVLDADMKQIKGTWYQGGASLPLTVNKTSEAVIKHEVKRPQTPKAPFPYASEEVSYENADRSIRFGGTFTVPLPDPNVEYFRAPVYPTVLLITGSGKQDRDESLMGHKPFWIIADYLSRNGIAVLRVDDRDMGKTTGDFSKATSADFAKDVEAGINYLRTRKDVDTNFIGLLGHSEGGLIAPMVAYKRTDIRFIVLLAGPGVKIIDLMEAQTIDVAASAGIPKEELEQFRPLYKKLVTAFLSENDSAKSFQKAVRVFNKWRKNIPDSVVLHTTGVKDEKTLQEYIRTSAESYRPGINPWFNYFIQFDPAVYLSQVKCPVLALNGENDIQVAAKPNLKAIETALKKGGNLRFTTKEMPGLNHLFQRCIECTVAEYGELEETFSAETLKMVVDWIKGL